MIGRIETTRMAEHKFILGILFALSLSVFSFGLAFIPGASAWADGEGPGAPATSESIPTPTVPTATKAGWLRDGDDWYYFADAGVDPARGWLDLNGTWYYLDPNDNGKMAMGLYHVNGTNYISDSSGAMQSNGWAKAGDGWYYASASGALRTGWLRDGGAWYWLDPAEGGAMATGWAWDGGAWYYFHGDGSMASGGWLHDGTSWYWLSGSGAMRTGWLWDGGAWYYLQPSGAMATGWVHDSNAWYLTSGSGAMQTGWQWVDGAWYYLQPSGAMQTGWLSDRGTWYWLTASGAMAAGQMIDDRGIRYYLNDSGAMATGWVKAGNDWYYADSSGAFQNGWVQLDGKWYWLQPDKGGLMVAGANMAIDGALYSFENSGAMRANTIVDLGDSKVGYASASGAIANVGVRENGKVVLKSATGGSLTGWQHIGGAWFYGDAGGVAHTGWLDLGGTWYWMDSDGVMATGVRDIDGKTYVFDGSGAWSPVSAAHAAVYARAVAELERCTTPSMTKEQKLWAAFVHIRDDFPEYNPRVPHWKSDGWENVYADDIFVGRGGNCLSCAAAMAFMAKAIGYENVYACNSGGHGWAEVDGLVYDPEWNRHHTGTYFARPYGMTGGPGYASAISAGYSWMRVAI